MNDAVTYQDFSDWYDDWTDDEYNDCPGRSNREDLREAFEAGYDLARGRLDGSGIP